MSKIVSARATAADAVTGGRGQFHLRRFSVLTPRALVVGASTGGPQALAALLPRIGPRLKHIPVVIVLHMPTNFTDVVTGQIAQLTGQPTSAAINGEELRPGHIYFAPGETHLKIVRVGPYYALAHFDGPPENFCKPAVDVLFRSAADAYGAGVLGVVLTGMGSDGLDGSRRIVEAGGSVIVQDEASSAVWGMPGAVARAGLAAAVAPVSQLADAIAFRLGGSQKTEAP
ncbi:MAG: chemotaxis protein CheB [Rhodoblastus sp.]|nr:chemotaxis protein CheB [Rhodoblastus sp.]